MKEEKLRFPYKNVVSIFYNKEVKCIMSAQRAVCESHIML